MFGIKKPVIKTVETLLEEVRTWIYDLEEASERAADEADELSALANDINMKAASAQLIADEGKDVADNFKKILFIS